MFKFLRKYNKLILAVGGTLLMIVFLIPQAIQGLSQRAALDTATQASIGSDQIPARELRMAQNELQAIDRLQIPLAQELDISDPWHWYLLVREADQAGCIGSVSLSQDEALQLRQATGLPHSDVEQLYARINGVGRMLQLYQTSGQFSDQRLRQRAAALFGAVGAKTVIIEARSDDVSYSPSAAEIEAQFEAYKDIDRDDAEARFGYRLPDRVKLETLSIPAESIRTSIEDSDALSGIALRKHWRKNSSNPVFPAQPATPTADIPDVIRADLLDTLTAEKAAEIERYATGQLRQRVRALSSDDAGYYRVGEDWPDRRLALPELAVAIQSRFGVALPTYVSGSNWLELGDLDDIDGIGDAVSNNYPPTPRRLRELVSVSRELAGSTIIPVQEGVAGPALRGTDNSVYLFRVTDIDPARAATNVDEVRDDVVADLRRLRNFETLRDLTAELRDEAVRSGLLGVAIANDTVVQPPSSFTRFDQLATFFRNQAEPDRTPSPVPTDLPVVGSDDTVVSQIVDFGLQLPGDAAIEDLDAADRVFAFASDKRLAIVVGRVDQVTPVTETSYKSLADQARNVIVTEELGLSVMDAFGFDALQARHDFTILRTTDEDAETTDDATQTAAAE